MALTPQQAYLKAEMIAAWPAGSEVVIDWNDPDGPGPLVEALTVTFSDYGVDVVKLLRLELSPLTCSAAGVALWEQSLALVGSKAAVSGTLNQQRAAVIARLREFGCPNFALIRSVLNLFLGYQDQSKIIIVESNRALVRAANQKAWTGSQALPATIAWTVRDDPRVSSGSAQVDIFIDITDLSWLEATLTGPDSTAVSMTNIANYPGPPPVSWLVVPEPWTTRAMIGTGSTFIWAVGDAGASYLYNGTIWINVSAGTETLRSVTLQNVTVIMITTLWTWVCGDNGLTKYTTDDTTWHTVSTGTTATLYGIYSVSTNAIWTVGAGGIALLYGGAAWLNIATGTTQDLMAVWGYDNSNVWAVGVGGIILYNSGGWAEQPSPTSQTLRAVWGLSTTDVWAAGDGGVILHWDGTSWTQNVSPTPDRINGIWGTASNNVYVVVDGGVLAHFNGTDWTLENSNTLQPLYAMWGSSASDIWGGGKGELIHAFSGSNAPNVRLYFPSGSTGLNPTFAGKPIYGTWTLTLGVTTGFATVYTANLLVEALGSYGTVGAQHDGLGAAMYEWGVVVQAGLLGPDFDLDGAARAIKRLTYARSLGDLLNGDDVTGVWAAIPDDPRSLPDACVPG